jgi:hypothetical protein
VAGQFKPDEKITRVGRGRVGVGGYRFEPGNDASATRLHVGIRRIGWHLPQRPKAPSPTWRSFLRNHMTVIAAVDMFMVATATFKLLYAVIFLSHHRRRVIHSRSPKTRPKPGSRSKSPRPFRGTPHLAICYETEIHRVVFASKIVSERWEMRRS